MIPTPVQTWILFNLEGIDPARRGEVGALLRHGRAVARAPRVVCRRRCRARVDASSGAWRLRRARPARRSQFAGFRRTAALVPRQRPAPGVPRRRLPAISEAHCACRAAKGVHMFASAFAQANCGWEDIQSATAAPRLRGQHQVKLSTPRKRSRRKAYQRLHRFTRRSPNRPSAVTTRSPLVPYSGGHRPGDRDTAHTSAAPRNPPFDDAGGDPLVSPSAMSVVTVPQRIFLITIRTSARAPRWRNNTMAAVFRW